jgi:hypothetical protein
MSHELDLASMAALIAGGLALFLFGLRHAGGMLLGYPLKDRWFKPHPYAEVGRPALIT